MIHITRQEEFSAAHRLYREDWSDERNISTYGKCANENYHGHNYILEVTLKAPDNEENGMAYNLAE